ncbi:ABC transporter permease subunit [Roseomonas sp. GC11]|uniref:ABC transporter permease subunit n=1 Tax=Roseomonas sp. GC11 TaxID=2950546 RepID=UPI00210E55C3|nr:ABC transporter permease subunit [Roseomonas sp. GC11]MCQ4160286.1 ABC transporter permease subunit [Roseomonas sp. GC11]
MALWPARAEVPHLRELDFVRAARAAGVRDGRILWRLILPNALPPLRISGTLTIGAAILFEGGLSFLGLNRADMLETDRRRPE